MIPGCSETVQKTHRKPLKYNSRSKRMGKCCFDLLFFTEIARKIDKNN